MTPTLDLPCHFPTGAARHNDRQMSNPDVSVIVPMRNAAQHVLEQVTALANQTPPEIDFEVIWVDNGSSDGTLQLVTERDPRRRPHARDLRTQECARHTSLETRGSRTPEANVLLFCDADDVVDVRLGAVDDIRARRFGRRRGALKLRSDEPPEVPSDPGARLPPGGTDRKPREFARTTFDALGRLRELDSSRRGHRAVLACASARAQVRLRARRAWCSIGGGPLNGPG